MSELFFSSDSHYWHSNVILYSKRPFSSVEEMNEALIANWNSVITDKDQVWHLGDFSFGTYEQTKSILKRLRGHKNYIFGNHDKILKRNPDLWDYFDSIQDYKELKWDKQSLILFHYPLLTWNRGHHSSYHLCGHSHGTLNWHHKQTTSLDVGVDNFNYTPVSFEEIMKIMSKKTYKATDHHGAAV